MADAIPTLKELKRTQRRDTVASPAEVASTIKCILEDGELEGTITVGT